MTMKNVFIIYSVLIIILTACITGCSSPQGTTIVQNNSPTITTLSQTVSPTTTPGTQVTLSPTIIQSATTSVKDTTASMNTVRVEESNLSVFAFSPGWRYRDIPAASGGSFAVTNYGAYGFNNIKVDIKFSGTSIALLYRTMSFGGIADVMIDGKNYPSIDMYSNIEKPATSIIATDLENTQHILTISPSAKYNPSVTFTPDVNKAIITVDAVEITRPG
jgi:hypothetical protein